MNLSKLGKVTRVSNAAVAATTDITTSTIDMQGYASICWYALFGAIDTGAVTSVKAQSGAASDMSDAADLAGTSISVADDDDNQVVILEVDQPRERYVRLIIDRGTATAAVDGVLAIQTKAFSEPITHDTTSVVGSEYHLAPAEGTA